MTIPTIKEPEDLYDNFGIYEKCVFCEKTTKYWHKRTNNPVCRDCAKEHKVAELHNQRKVAIMSEFTSVDIRWTGPITELKELIKPSFDDYEIYINSVSSRHGRGFLFHFYDPENGIDCYIDKLKAIEGNEQCVAIDYRNHKLCKTGK